MRTRANNASLDLDSNQHSASEPVHVGNPNVSGLTQACSQKAPRWPSNGMRASPGPSDYNIMRLFDNTKQRRCRAIPWSRKAKLGTGCQGIVWRGTFKRLPYAVKVMKAEKPSALEIRNLNAARRPPRPGRMLEGRHDARSWAFAFAGYRGAASAG